jgi:hypothetical protein
LTIHVENGADILRVFDWNEATNSGSWRFPTAEQIETGIIAETKDEFDRLKVAAPLGSFDTDGRKARAAFVNEQGVDAYLNRNKSAGVIQTTKGLFSNGDQRQENPDECAHHRVAAWQRKPDRPRARVDPRGGKTASVMDNQTRKMGD